MEIFLIKFNIGSKFSYSDQLIKAIKENFHYDLSDKNLNNIFILMTNLDGTLSRKIKRGELFEWRIQVKGDFIKSNRFQNLIPYLFLNKKLENLLYDFQKEGVRWLLNNPSRILADDMGLGKTIQSLDAIQKLFFEQKILNCFIFCPKSLIYNWQIEIKKWLPLFEISIFRDVETKSNVSNFNFSNSHNICIISYSEAYKVKDLLDKNDIVVDLLIADEAHKLRNETSQLNNLIGKIKRNRTWLLTGTPLERDSKDIKNILTLLYPKKALAFSQLQDISLKSNLKQNSLRRLKKDVLHELPETSKHLITLEMSDTQKELYEKTLKDMGNVSGKERISFISQLVQVAAGLDQIDSCKYERAIEIVKDCIQNSEKVIIFSTYNIILKTFQKKLNQNNIKSLLFTGELDQNLRNFNLNKFKTEKDIYVLNVNSNVGSEGLTLVEASNVIFLNEWWNPSSNRQAEDRVNRIGQKRHSDFFILRSKNTIDDNIGYILDHKTKIEKSFVDELISSF